MHNPAAFDYLSADDVVGQARGLLGATLSSELDGQVCSARIVETEAYRGRDDRACHAYGYKRTKRTEVFFGPAGRAYVYLVYGIHRMFNVICGPAGEPNGILIRAVEPLTGGATMLARRRRDRADRRLTGGPGLLCQAFGIELGHSGLDLLMRDSPIRLTGPYETLAHPGAATASPRVGVAYAGEDAARPWRFRVPGNAFTSPAR